MAAALEGLCLGIFGCVRRKFKSAMWTSLSALIE
jgi:hypothetical protein